MKGLASLFCCLVTCLAFVGCGGDSASKVDVDPVDVEQYNSPADYDPNEGLGPEQK